MASKSVRRFNRDEAAGPHGLARSEKAQDFAYSAGEEGAARIPANEDAQVYELRRMFRL